MASKYLSVENSEGSCFQRWSTRFNSGLYDGRYSNSEMGMYSQKRVNFRSMMPLYLIHIRGKAPSNETAIKNLKKFQKSFPISLKNWKKSILSPQRFNKAKEIKSLSIFTLFHHLNPSPAFHSKTPQARMKRETRLIPKNTPSSIHDGPKFFLRPRRNRGALLLLVWINRYPGFFNTSPSLWSQFRAFRVLIKIPHSFLRYSTTVTPSQRVRWSPGIKVASFRSFSSITSGLLIFNGFTALNYFSKNHNPI